MSESPVLSLEHVEFSYGAAAVLEDITLDVQRGEFLGIVGPNGSGKTTLLQVALGRLKPRRGRVRLFGQDVAGFREWWRIGYVPQKAARFDSRFPATVREVVAAGRFGRAGLGRRLGREDRLAVEEAMAVVGLADLRGRLIGQLSGGQQQRAIIARALAAQPDLLILDEPTTGIDPGSEEAFYSLLRRLNREMGLTLIMVTHDIGVVTAEVNRLACINRRLTYHGDPATFLSGPGLQQLYGTPVHLISHKH